MKEKKLETKTPLLDDECSDVYRYDDVHWASLFKRQVLAPHLIFIKNVSSDIVFTMMRLISTTPIILILLIETSAFAPHIPIRQRCVPRVSKLFYQNNASDGKLEIPFQQPARILPRGSANIDEPTPSFEFTQQQSTTPVAVPPTLVFPATTVRQKEKSSNFNLSKQWQSVQKWRTRPGVQFRVRLGVLVTAALAATSLLLPHSKVLVVTKRWVSHRGFQGIAALGRSVAYLWALLVGYPRMLDRRASDRRRQSRDKALERRREQLQRLAAEVARLRQERTTLDAEIRAFRREIIALKAYAKDSTDSEEIQEAIKSEMAHLSQLRSDTARALSAAQQSWTEFRSASPPEIWNDSLIP